VSQLKSHPSVQRFFQGAPILSPTARVWESGVTFNAAVTFVPQTHENRDLLTKLLAGTVYHNRKSQDGLVAVHYRARPKSDPGYLITRSYVGLALFTPDLELIYRFPDPIVKPEPGKTDFDYLGVEDPRITLIDGKFVMVYCGSAQDAAGSWIGSLCTADSSDLLHWKKNGSIDLQFPLRNGSANFDDSYFDNANGAKGNKTGVNNKDGVLFPRKINGSYYLLHRPMIGNISDWAMHLAKAETLEGPWQDCGPMFRAEQRPEFVDAWVGAGAVPIDLGNGRFLEIFHTGHRAADGSRLYTMGAVVFNFNEFDPSDPASLIESRLDHFMIPETKFEIEGPYPDSVGNVLFSCGAYERNGEIVILYGGGDTFVMAAKVRKSELLASLVPVTQSV
jgi:beta-1,2-mannobiose phosphorylase / 1,2-beta-oligomannan phosphorylase